MDDPRAEFGRAVRKQRQKAGMSQEELADKAELHRTYVGQVERGETNISLVNIVRLARALRIEVQQLMKDL